MSLDVWWFLCIGLQWNGICHETSCSGDCIHAIQRSAFWKGDLYFTPSSWGKPLARDPQGLTGLTVWWCLVRWRFPKIMVPPNHPLNNRVFHYFHHPFWGVSQFLVQHPDVTCQGEEGILMVRESLCNVDAETAGAWCLEVSDLRDVSWGGTTMMVMMVMVIMMMNMKMKKKKEEEEEENHDDDGDKGAGASDSACGGCSVFGVSCRFSYTFNITSTVFFILYLVSLLMVLVSLWLYIWTTRKMKTRSARPLGSRPYHFGQDEKHVKRIIEQSIGVLVFSDATTKRVILVIYGNRNRKCGVELASRVKNSICTVILCLLLVGVLD